MNIVGKKSGIVKQFVLSGEVGDAFASVHVAQVESMLTRDAVRSGGTG